MSFQILPREIISDILLYSLDKNPPIFAPQYYVNKEWNNIFNTNFFCKQVIKRCYPRISYEFLKYKLAKKDEKFIMKCYWIKLYNGSNLKNKKSVCNTYTILKYKDYSLFFQRKTNIMEYLATHIICRCIYNNETYSCLKFMLKHCPPVYNNITIEGINDIMYNVTEPRLISCYFNRLLIYFANESSYDIHLLYALACFDIRLFKLLKILFSCNPFKETKNHATMNTMLTFIIQNYKKFQNDLDLEIIEYILDNLDYWENNYHAMADIILILTRDENKIKSLLLKVNTLKLKYDVASRIDE